MGTYVSIKTVDWFDSIWGSVGTGTGRVTVLLSKHRRYAALRMGGFRAYNGNAAWAVLDRFL